MIVWFTCGSAGCIPKGMGFITSEVCDLSIVMMIVRYLWCTVANVATTLDFISILWLWKYRDR